MKLSDFKKHLSVAKSVSFELPNHKMVVPHFHITEVGTVTRNSIDCGGNLHHNSFVNFQIWQNEDIDHRLTPIKLLNIISKSEQLFGNMDFEIEVEYQTDTIGKYNLGVKGENFVLIPTHTDCLAKDDCGVPVLEPVQKQKTNTCSPGGGCC
ncbi:MAG TPA: DUF6428 family protein [Cytophagaceae bacterium]|jgi:hypothetical protein|nr:DUF6428 family protein [Cytophagaceae bacterium]